MATKKTHPADAADLALIPACKKFTATILKNNKQQTVSFDTLAAARIEAARLNATANNGRKALVYAITAEGRAILVPASYGSSEPAKAEKPATPAKAEKPAKPAEAAKAAKPKAERPKAAKPKAEGFHCQGLLDGRVLKEDAPDPKPLPPAPSSSPRAGPNVIPTAAPTPTPPLLRDRRRLWGGRHLHRQAPSPSGSQSR